MAVGTNQDGYWDCERMCSQLRAAFTFFDLTRDSYRLSVSFCDKSTGHNAHDDDALLVDNF